MKICLLGRTLVGKTTLAEELVRRDGFHHLPLCTTRPKRDSNEPDRRYMSIQEYFVCVERGEFMLQYQWVDGHFYGILRSSVTEAESGDWVLNLDYDGVKLRELGFYPILLKAPDFVLLNRYRGQSDRYSGSELGKRMNVKSRSLRTSVDSSGEVSVTYAGLSALLIGIEEADDSTYDHMSSEVISSSNTLHCDYLPIIPNKRNCFRE